MASVVRYITNILRWRWVKFLLVGVALGLVYMYYRSAPNATFTENNHKFYHSDKLEKKAEEILNNEEGMHHPAAKMVRMQAKSLEKEAEKLHEKNAVSKAEEIDIIITFTNAANNWNLREKFEGTVSTMLNFSSINLAVHIIGDAASQKIAAELMQKASEKVGAKAKYRMVNLDVEELATKMREIVKPMQDHFSYKPGAYYNAPLFFLSIAMHRVMPEKMHRVIMMDCDLKFASDIRELHQLFNDFKPDSVMGLAHEMQPVYRHTFWSYRQKNPGTRVGEPPPTGLTGFNSGVVLLNLDRMRKSVEYNNMIDGKKVKELTEKYGFKGHLGDQDFFTLISMEREGLFYVLPCSWNRQLCIWWKDKGYQDVFDLYHKCEGKINIWHGNCNTPFPV